MTASTRFRAIINLRCPVCREGAVFRGTFAMNEACPVCGLVFAREPGYFLGAMYFSYGLGIPMIVLLTLGAYFIWPTWRLWQLVLVAWLAFLPFVPWVYRISRVLWLHFDRYCDPD